MHDWGLGSYDAVHAATTTYTGAAIVTLDTGAVPADQLTIYIDHSRLTACRRPQGWTRNLAQTTCPASASLRPLRHTRAAPRPVRRP